MAVADTASGGETMAPSKNAKGQEISSISQCAATATATVVKSTRPTAASVMGRIVCLNSDQLVYHAAWYKSGGKNIIKTTSGFKATTGSPGIILMITPQSTSTIGTGKLYLLLKRLRNATPNNNMIITVIFSIYLILFGFTLFY